jgi:uncharacterized protein (DUF1800 family)
MHRYFSRIQVITAAVVVFSILFPAVSFSSGQSAKRSALTEDQKILHVLNRLGYGPRPGDVNRVKAMGLRNYIDSQINAVSVPDAAAEQKVKHLEAFALSTSELFAKYPNPGALLRQLEGGRAAQAANQQQNAAGDEARRDEQRERRQKLQALYREYDLRPANQLLPQIVANRVLRAVYSERQLQEVMVDFWQNHFNVYAGKAAVRWYVPSYERDVLRPNALGNFKDLLVGTAQHPAMLFYLDNFESVSPNAQMPGRNGALMQALQTGSLRPRQRERLKERYGVNDAQLDARLKQMQGAANRPRRGINENYARELMELHTLGVDGGYSQQDIIEVAKAFTGWTIADARGYRRSAANMIKGEEDKQIERLRRVAGVPEDIDSGEFYFNDRIHDKSTKTVLGHKINEGGIKDGLKVIDILANHPNTAKFIAKKLAIKFVSDTPSDAFVGRIADAFNKSKGDIKATLSAMFNDKEFFAPENYRAKIKSPFELAVSSVRALGGDTNSSPAFIAMLNKLGEVPYGYIAPTGYPDTAADWVNTGALLERLNFAVAVASNRIPGTKVDLSPYATADKRMTLEQAIRGVLHGEISAATRDSLLTQLEKPLPEVKAAAEPVEPGMPAAGMMTLGGGGNRPNRQARLLAPSGNPDVFKAVSLVLGSPEFQRQ